MTPAPAPPDTAGLLDALARLTGTLEAERRQLVASQEAAQAAERERQEAAVAAAPAEAERDAERRRADEAAQRVAALEAERERLVGPPAAAPRAVAFLSSPPGSVARCLLCAT